jgi:hypothetical protein
MIQFRRERVAALGLLACVVLSSGCSSTPPAPPQPALLGEVAPAVSVKELMASQIDPIADNIFDAVVTDITAQGVVETAPETDEDWAKVKMGAVTLAEAANLLKIPRPFAPPGDENESHGPNAPELSPAQIQAKVDADRALWSSHVEELRSVALEVMEIVKKKDVQALFDAGGKLDRVCEKCHLEYWYPGDRKYVIDYEKAKAGRKENGGKP